MVMKSKPPIRTQFIFIMLVHHILTMAAIQYEEVISSDLTNLIISLAEDLQKLPTYNDSQ